MTSYYTITLIIKNTKLCLQSHQICVVFTIRHYCLRQKLLDVGAISSSCVPMYSPLNVTRNQHRHHIKVICSINSYVLRSLPLNCTHKPQRDASHWNSAHNKTTNKHKQKVNAHFTMNSKVPRQSQNEHTSFTRMHQIWRHGFKSQKPTTEIYNNHNNKRKKERKQKQCYLHAFDVSFMLCVASHTQTALFNRYVTSTLP